MMDKALEKDHALFGTYLDDKLYISLFEHIFQNSYFCLEMGTFSFSMAFFTLP
jgi:hypothetical protein